VSVVFISVDINGGFTAVAEKDSDPGTVVSEGIEGIEIE
jgi:hypothetical protein